MDIRRATRQELDEVGALLEAGGLPPLPSGISLADVLVGISEDSVIGVVALDVVARRGLTLWLAVAADHRGRGLGTSLLRGLISRAQELGLRELYAVDRGAAKLFLALGFKPVPTGEVPGDVRSIRACREHCRDVTEVMRLELTTRF